MEYGVVLRWWLVYQILLLAGFPIAARLVPRFPDRGASLALPTALVALVVPTYWLGQVAFSGATILVALLALGTATYLAGRGGVDLDRRTYAETVFVFTLAFTFLIAVRALDPSAHAGGGEKFLDMGLLQSLLRATSLPPADVWFAGERVQYYYGGHLVSALLAKLTWTPGRYAYNLALAGFYAMEVTAVFGIAAAIADERGVPRRLAGAIAAVAFGFASNLLTPARLAATLLPEAAVRWVGETVAIAPKTVTVTPEEFTYWTASRVIPDTINEFPLFSYLNGDLHAHMMNLTFLLLLVGVLYGYYRTPATGRRRRLALLFGVVPPVVGVVLATNTWSVPTALGMTWLAVTFAPAGPATLHPRTDAYASEGGWLREEVCRSGLALLAAAAVGVIAFAWVAPFVPNVLLQSAGGRHLAVLPTRSGLGPFLLVHGGFVAAFAAYLAGLVRLRDRLWLLAAGVPLLFAAGWALDLAALAVAGPLLVGGWYLLRTDRAGFETVLLVGGAGLVTLVEFVYVADNAAPERMNTVFKTYLDVWTLWATAAGVGLAAVLSRRRTALPVSTRTRRALGAVFAVGLLVSVSAYGGLALQTHVEWGRDDPTLDALQFTHDYHPDEAEAIEWVNDLEGQPTIAAAPTWKVYAWGNPASSLTGVPTVAGWAHEAIYRGYDTYHDRTVDVETLYTGDLAAREAVVDRYDVRYIYVGPAERERYGDPSFDGVPWVSVAFENENVRIYAVDDAAVR